jgi:pimeloyl-ACP methyl ester carboxylesterase
MTLHYKKFGSPRDRAVVLLHPFPFSGKVLYQTAGLIAQNGYFVVVPDLPGFGQSELESGATQFEILATRVSEILDELNIPTAILGGVSLGGYVAMSFVRQFPKRTQGLILIDTKASADSADARSNRLRVAEQMRQDPRLGLFAQQLLPNLLSHESLTHRPGLAMAIEAEISQVNPLAIAWMQEAMAQRQDSFADLASFSGSTLLVRGEQDALCSSNDFKLMEKACQDSEFCELAEVGHLPNMEAPEELAQVLASWLMRSAVLD